VLRIASCRPTSTPSWPPSYVEIDLSKVLMRLGAANRGEAAAIVYRLWLLRRDELS
jgi:hypothetical protein